MARDSGRGRRARAQRARVGCGAQGPGRRAQGGRREGAGRGCTSRLCFDRFDSISFCEGGFDSLFESVRTKPLAHLSVRAS